MHLCGLKGLKAITRLQAQGRVSHNDIVFELQQLSRELQVLIYPAQANINQVMVAMLKDL